MSVTPCPFSLPRRMRMRIGRCRVLRIIMHTCEGQSVFTNTDCIPLPAGCASCDGASVQVVPSTADTSLIAAIGGVTAIGAGKSTTQSAAYSPTDYHTAGWVVWSQPVMLPQMLPCSHALVQMLCTRGQIVILLSLSVAGCAAVMEPSATPSESSSSFGGTLEESSGAVDRVLLAAPGQRVPVA
jgi:hypothetical protein